MECRRYIDHLPGTQWQTPAVDTSSSAAGSVVFLAYYVTSQTHDMHVRAYRDRTHQLMKIHSPAAFLQHIDFIRSRQGYFCSVQLTGQTDHNGIDVFVAGDFFSGADLRVRARAQKTPTQFRHTALGAAS